MVSVLINNYNYESYIEEAIRSVLNQTYKNWELIIVDDGSIDHSAEIIRKYELLYPDRIRAVYKENGGQASALNAGFALAKGEVIAFLDSDDYWFPEKLSVIVQAHDQHDYVVNSFQSNGPEKSRCNKQYISKSSYLLKKYGYQVLASTPTSSISIKKAVLDKVFPIPEDEYRISADAYIDLFSLYFSNYFYVDQKLTYYRFHNLNGFYGKENSFNTHKFSYDLIENVNKKLQKSGLLPIPFRSIDSQIQMYKEIDSFEIKENVRYLVYGAGDIGIHVAKLAARCHAEIFCFCESSKNRQNQNFCGYKIISAEEIMMHRESFDNIIIASTFYTEEIEKRLIDMGLKKGEDYIYTTLFCDDTFDSETVH